MIIIGYQGIGKSTLAKKDHRYIDLESGNFWYDHGDGSLKRDELWYLPYCNVAEHLSRQGFRVFVSSHKVVRDRLKQSEEKVMAVYPQKHLKDKWIEKLEQRYKESNLEKDYKALMNAKQCYTENINDLTGDTLCWAEINNMDYDLGKLIDRCLEHC